MNRWHSLNDGLIVFDHYEREENVGLSEMLGLLGQKRSHSLF